MVESDLILDIEKLWSEIVKDPKPYEGTCVAFVDLARTHGFQRAWSKALRYYGFCVGHREPRAAESILLEALEVATQALDIEEQLGACMSLASLYGVLGDNRRSFEYRTRELLLSQQLHDIEGTYSALTGLAYLSAQDGLYLEACGYAKQALALEDSINDARFTRGYDSRALLAQLFQDAGNLDASRSLAILGLERARRRNDVKMMTVLLRVAAGTDIKLRNFDSAAIHLEELKTLVEAGVAPEISRDVVDLQCCLLTAQGEFASVAAMSVHLAEERHINFNWHITKHVSEALIALGNASGAIDLLHAERQKMPSSLLPVDQVYHEQLAAAYEALGDYRTALDHYKQADDFYDRIFSSRFRTELSAVEVLLAIEREKHLTEEARLKSEYLERELTNSTLQLLAQTELLSDLRDSLLAIVRRFPSDAATTQLREKLKSLPTKAVDWEKFDTQFKAAHPECTKSLTEKYPGLTVTEVRICSLLRMHMKSEDIARLFALSERTIEVHRYNIRKKLSLSKQQDLSLFLASL
jgi:DNA-binding CsgD family transcriptional regulator/tetratricopeptide (TPR) repeat protein